MEQHPVPRNITGFQFHLIGDMTLRQFGYLAGGVVIAFFIFRSLPLPSLFKYILAGMFAFAGFAFAFLPIQERPLDKWLVAFIKSVFSPTQYLWHKNNQPPNVLLVPIAHHAQVVPQEHKDAHEEAKRKLDAYLKTLPKQSYQTLNTAEQHYVEKTMSLFQTVNQPVVKPASPPPVNQPLSQPVVKKPTPQPQLIPKQQEQKTSVDTVDVKLSQKVKTQYSDLKQQMESLAKEKEILLKELENLKNRVNAPHVKPEVVKPQEMQVKQSPTIKAVPAEAIKEQIGMPSLPQTPNIVIGVIKDAERKLMPNIIVTIKDKAGLPQRALKTNKLGQFASATPLPNGTYYIEIEDPLNRYIFDIAEINLTGKVFLPVEITAKGEKEIMREKLHNELFGKTAAI